MEMHNIVNLIIFVFGLSVISNPFYMKLKLLLSAGDNEKEIDEEVAKEWEHTILQNTMDRELNELNKRLEQKEVYLPILANIVCVGFWLVNTSHII